MPKHPPITVYDLPGLPRLAATLEELLHTIERRFKNMPLKGGARNALILHEMETTVSLINRLMTTHSQATRCESLTAALTAMRKTL